MKTIEVNLLPVEHLPENPFSLRNTLYLVLSLLVLIFLGVDTHQIYEREQTFKAESEQLVDGIGKFRQLKTHIDMLRRRTALLRDRSSLITEVISHRLTWSDKLSEIYLQVPADVLWLSEISLERRLPNQVRANPTKKDKKTTVPQQEQFFLHIVGEAKDLSNIAEFIFRLEEISFLGNTQFRTIDEKEETGRTVMSFEIFTQVNVEGATRS